MAMRQVIIFLEVPNGTPSLMSDKVKNGGLCVYLFSCLGGCVWACVSVCLHVFIHVYA